MDSGLHRAGAGAGAVRMAVHHRACHRRLDAGRDYRLLCLLPGGDKPEAGSAVMGHFALELFGNSLLFIGVFLLLLWAMERDRDDWPQ